MIGDIQARHYEQILKMNAEFVHWLSPMDLAELKKVLSIAQYTRQVDDGAGVLIGYAHDADYPEHKNMTWLRQHLNNFFYIDRVIIDAKSQGRNYGRLLYADIENYARTWGFSALACEVNTKPNNPGSHAFHEQLGFKAITDVDYPAYNKSVRYYQKPLGF